MRQGFNIKGADSFTISIARSSLRLEHKPQLHHGNLDLYDLTRGL